MIKLSIFSYQAEDGIRDRNVTGVQTRALPIFLLALGCVLGLSYRAARYWFRQAQQARDAARSEWINGVSHDIRTPLSVGTGYAAQLKEAPDRSPTRPTQAASIRTHSHASRDP